ncbi:outer membrane protein, multidrug efflux system [Methylomarinovum tepidoasis]|uniref:Outer membrane protein, multidrug efflux system n=1 Tax=Methylomarinovum tepidoasis TaxID=2840183 RepID=A0AAU9C5Y9_9GAMM|nr:efflux transporter outer membrane subunit [Methylomarinovum sp. IN45]BCX88579.1 outer membrane protein, multidrug efflux system [Methylomarinovum sp. IN45]
MKRIALTVAIAALLDGCMLVGPDYHTPEAPVADTWIDISDPALKRTETDLSEWWQVFGDPVLDELVLLARRQNLSLQATAIRILEARAQLGIASGLLYPQHQRITGDLSRQQISEHAPNTTPAIDRRFTTTGIGFDVGWELDLWGKFRRGVEAAEANLDASVADYEDLLVSLTAEVARTYVLIRTLESRIRVAHENLEIQRRTLNIADALYKGGAITELDYLQAESLLHTTEASIPPLEAALRQAKNALAVLLGRPPGEVDSLLMAFHPIPSPPVEVVIGVPADLLRRRPDVRRVERRLATQSALIGVTKADLYPHFSLLGSINLRASDAALTFASGGSSKLADLFTAKSFQYFVGPSLSWDVFNYGRIRNQVRAEDARFQALIADYRNTVLEAAREAEDAIAAFVKARVEQERRRLSYEAARRSVDLSLLQYREGLVSYQRVLDSRRSLLTAQDDLTRIRGDVAVNLIALYKALGGGWQERDLETAVPEEVKREMAQRTNWKGLLETGEPRKEKPTRWRWPDW